MKTSFNNSSAFRYLYLIIFACTAVSCEHEIPYNVNQSTPLLIMNAQLHTGNEANYVYLHLGKGCEIIQLTEATLTLYVNGQVVETLQPTFPESIYDHPEHYTDEYIESFLQSAPYKSFRLTTPLHPGDRIRLEASGENNNYHVSAEVTAPFPIESLSVDTCQAYLRDINGLQPYRRYGITLADRPNEKNFYQLEIRNDIHTRYLWKEYLTDDNGGLIPKPVEGGWEWDYVMKEDIHTSDYHDIITNEDVILTDGQPYSYEDENNNPFPAIKNLYNIFTDSRFTNGTATLRVYTPLYTHNYYSPNVMTEAMYRSQTITVSIHSLTEEGYRYLKALNCLNDENYEEVLMEPVILPCNVTGGLGFVNVSTEYNMTLELPETEIIPTDYTVWQSNN